MRRATVNDVDWMLREAEREHAQSHYNGVFSFDPEVVRETLYRVLENGAIFVEPPSMIGGMVNPTYFSTDKIAQAFWWWVPPEKRNGGPGVALLRSFVRWAQSEGAKAVLATSQTPNGPVPVPGFEPFESTAIRVV